MGRKNRFRVYYDANLKDSSPYFFGNTYVKKSICRIENTLSVVKGKINGSSVLDIGASPFYFLYRCQMEGAKKTAGVFYSEDNHVLRKEKTAYTSFGEIDLAHINVLKEPLPYPDDSFDIVGAMEIFEHFPEFPFHLLSEITRVTKKQGLFFITVPNACRVANVAKPILKKNVFMKYRNDPFGRHAHEYTRQQAVDLLRESVKGINSHALPIFKRVLVRNELFRKAATVAPFTDYLAPIWCCSAELQGTLTPNEIRAPSSLYDRARSVEL